MKTGLSRSACLGALAAVVAAASLAPMATAAQARQPNRVHAKPAHGKARIRSANVAGFPARQLMMSWHHGQVMTSADVTSVFWGNSWNRPASVGDKIAGIDSLYRGIGGTSYMNTNTEFKGSNVRVGKAVAYRGHLIDPSAAGPKSPPAGIVLRVVARSIAHPVQNGYYPVYSDIPRGKATFCAWHSSGTINKVTVQFGFFFRLDGDPMCDPHDKSGLHSEGLAALANVSGHELSEAVTNPRGGGWFDGAGNENADKCAWRFPDGLITMANGTRWKIQGNFSNAAYRAHSGYDGGGCIVARTG